MTTDPLLTDDLGALLGLFPQDTLRALLDVMGNRTSWSPFPDQRATAAHASPRDADLRPYAPDIARELLWWGSNDLHLDFGAGLADWPMVVRTVAKKERVKPVERDDVPAWRTEEALLKQLLARWEKMTPEQRREAMQKAGANLDATRGGMAAAGGGAMAAAEAATAFGGSRLLAFLAARLAPVAVAGPAVPFIAPALTVLGGVWAAYDLAGPALRVLRPTTLLVALTRRQLRNARLAAAFEE